MRKELLGALLLSMLGSLSAFQEDNTFLKQDSLKEWKCSKGAALTKEGLEVTSEKFVLVRRYLPVDQLSSKRVVMEVEVKGEIEPLGKRSSGGRFGLIYKDSKGKSFYPGVPLPKGKFPWTKIRMEQLLPADLQSINIELGAENAKGKFVYRNLKFTAQETVLDFRNAMNMGFADEKENDGKGGWSDQGPDNDMSSLKPGILNFSGLKFDVVDPASNGGRSCLAMKSSRMRGMPQTVTVEFEKPSRGKYLYVLHALSFPGKKGSEIGEIACKLDSIEAVEKQTLTFPVVSGVHVGDFWMPRDREKGLVAWRGNNVSAPVGLYATCYELTGEPVRRITFTSRANANWLIVGATLADWKIDKAPAEPVTIRAGKEWLPIRNPGRVEPGSAIDFSRFLDAPAGKYGHLVRKGNHFEFENRPGVPFRFYGSNIVYWIHYQPKDVVDRMAEHYAATGYNILRLHLFDIPQSVLTENGEVKIRPDFMDKLDYLVAAFKKKGVYITLDLFGTRKIRKGELADFPDQEFTHREFKSLMYVSENALRNYESYVAGLMNHVNPYTGSAWKDEPAIATVCLVNEGTISGEEAARVMKTITRRGI